MVLGCFVKLGNSVHTHRLLFLDIATGSEFKNLGML